MTDDTPRRFASGGLIRRPLGEIPVRLTPVRFCMAPPPPAWCSDFAYVPNFTGIDAPGLGAEGAAIMGRIIDLAMLEASARAITLGLVREFGVTVPLKAFRRLPKPMLQLDSLVLDKLEGVAVHLGAP